MSHRITIRPDRLAEAAFALLPAWHGLGTVLDHPMTSAEAIKEAKLDWEVVQVPVAHLAGNRDAPRNWVTVPDVLANCRSDNGALLGLVKSRYRVLQNVDAFRFLDDLVESGQMRYESAFSLSGGRQVVLLARLPQVDTIVQEDDLHRYLLLGLDHTGEGAIRFGPTSVRVVCANTYALALEKGNRTREIISIHHTGNVKRKLEDAARLLERVNGLFEKFRTISRQLAGYRLGPGEWQRFLEVLFPLRGAADSRARKEAAASREALGKAMASSRQNIAGIENTAWAAFCAVAEFVDHVWPRMKHKGEEPRFKMCIEGKGHEVKRRAFMTACQMAGVSPAA